MGEYEENFEALVALGEADLALRLRILVLVMDEARANGDERWKSLAEWQVTPIQAAIAEIHKRERQARNESEPESVVVPVKVGQLGAIFNFKEQG